MAAAAARLRARLPFALPSRAPLLALVLAVAALLGGCAQVSAYGRSRTMDALDTVPLSIAWGWGLSASVKATPLVSVGLGLSPVTSERFGFEDRRLWGVWHEFEAAFPWAIFITDISQVPRRPPGANDGRLFGDGLPLMYRWQLDRDAPTGEGHHRGRWEPIDRQWGRHPPYGRETGGGFIIPAYRRVLTWHDIRLDQGDEEGLRAIAPPDRATLWSAGRDGPNETQSWDLFQADVFLGVLGLRVGLRPVEFADFLLGFVLIDFANDDLRATTSSLPPAEQL